LAAGLTPAFAAEYYVSPAGSDQNPGTFKSPFRTIERAANVAAAGDVVTIRGGVYHETVTPQHSGERGAPIVFRAYRRERVTIDGADVVSGWSTYQGAIYKAALSATLGTGNDQIFVDGQMMNEARWPSTSLDPMRPVLATAGPGTTASQISDPALTTPAAYWKGATVWFLGGDKDWEPWVAQTATVTDSTVGSVTFGKTPLDTPDCLPVPGTRYYLTNGPLSSLDSPTEWWYGGGQLYLWLPGSDAPATHAIEAKRRQVGFDLTDRQFIRLENVCFFATGLSLANAFQCVVDHCQFQYVSHFVTIKSGWDTRDDLGIVIGGHDNVLENSIIRYSAGNGVAVLGSHNTVTNCYIRGADYAGTDSTGIRVTGDHQIVTDNTVTETARAGLLNRVLKASRILRNDISEFSMWTQDTGGTYCWQTDGQGTEIAYNRVHDATDTFLAGRLGGRRVTSGIYLDNGSPNFIVHHNLIYNVDEGMRLNDPSLSNQIYNNTVENNAVGLGIAGGGDLHSTRIVNNIFHGAIEHPNGATIEKNLASGIDPLFASPIDGDFTLRPGSPAVDAGEVLPPYTDGYRGNAPDIGAFEQSVQPWKAGADFVPAQPVGVVASPTDSGVAVTWKRSGSLTYTVLMRPGFGPWTTVRAGLKTGSFVISGLKNGAAYQIAIEAVDATGLESPLSRIVTATPSTRP
jgi:hypothetical protein